MPAVRRSTKSTSFTRSGTPYKREPVVSASDHDNLMQQAELRKVTAHRMGALAALQAAVNERLDVNTLTGVKRAMALSSSKLAKRVKDELKDQNCGEITAEFFSLKDNNKLLVARLDLAEAYLVGLMEDPKTCSWPAFEAKIRAALKLKQRLQLQKKATAR